MGLDWFVKNYRDSDGVEHYAWQALGARRACLDDPEVMDAMRAHFDGQFEAHQEMQARAKELEASILGLNADIPGFPFSFGSKARQAKRQQKELQAELRPLNDRLAANASLDQGFDAWARELAGQDNPPIILECNEQGRAGIPQHATTMLQYYGFRGKALETRINILSIFASEHGKSLGLYSEFYLDDDGESRRDDEEPGLDIDSEIYSDLLTRHHTRRRIENFEKLLAAAEHRWLALLQPFLRDEDRGKDPQDWAFEGESATSKAFHEREEATEEILACFGLTMEDLDSREFRWDLACVGLDFAVYREAITWLRFWEQHGFPILADF